MKQQVVRTWKIHLFALFIFPSLAGITIWKGTWFIPVSVLYLIIAGVFLKLGMRLRKGKFLLPFLFSLSGLGFLQVMAGESVSPWLVLSIFTILLWSILSIMIHDLHREFPEARKWLEIVLYLTVFLGLSVIFGMVYIYAIPWGVGVLMSAIFLWITFRLLFQVMRVRISELILPVLIVLLLEIGVVYVFMPFSHTILAASLVVFGLVSVSLYKSWIEATWTWRQAVTQISIGGVLEGVLFFTGV